MKVLRCFWKPNGMNGFMTWNRLLYLQTTICLPFVLINFHYNFKCKWTIRMKMCEMRDFELCVCVNCICFCFCLFFFQIFVALNTKCGWLNSNIVDGLSEEMNETISTNLNEILFKAWSRCKTCQNISILC